MKAVYVLWGPSAEWGDGSGILGVYETRTAAEAEARSYREDTITLATECLAEPTYVPPFEADAARIRRARRRVRDGRHGISYATACEALGWPYTVAGLYVECVEPGDLRYADLAGELAAIEA